MAYLNIKTASFYNKGNSFVANAADTLNLDPELVKAISDIVNKKNNKKQEENELGTKLLNLLGVGIGTGGILGSGYQAKNVVTDEAGKLKHNLKTIGNKVYDAVREGKNSAIDALIKSRNSTGKRLILPAAGLVVGLGLLGHNLNNLFKNN